MSKTPTYTIINPCQMTLRQSTISEYEAIKTFAETTYKTLKGGELAILQMPSIASQLTHKEYDCKLEKYSNMLKNEEYFKKNSVLIDKHISTGQEKKDSH